MVCSCRKQNLKGTDLCESCELNSDNRSRYNLTAVEDEDGDDEA